MLLLWLRLMNMIERNNNNNNKNIKRYARTKIVVDVEKTEVMMFRMGFRKKRIKQMKE